MQQKKKLPLVEFKLKYKLSLDEDEYIEATKAGLLDWYKMIVSSYGRDAGDHYVAEYSGRIVFQEKIKLISRNLLLVIEEYIKEHENIRNQDIQKLLGFKYGVIYAELKRLQGEGKIEYIRSHGGGFWRKI